MVIRVALFTALLVAVVVVLATGITGLILRAWGQEALSARDAMVACALMSLILGPVVLGPLVWTALRLRDLYARLREAALTDALTGIANRRAFFHEAAALIAAAREGGEPEPRLAVLMIDVDAFKAINDRHGHEVGDAALVHVAARIVDALARLGEREAPVARLGGEEFAVLLMGAGGAGARRAAEAVVAGVRGAPFRHGGERVAVTVSVGVWAGATGAIGPALAAADRAVYAAKEAGRDRWRAAA